MYCKNCGEKIEDNSRFCAFCGTLQKIPNTNPSLNTQQFVDYNTINKIETLFGVKLSKKIVGIFLLWVLLQLILLLTNWNNSSYASDKIWPFSNYSEMKHYDFTEFLLYTIVPILILIIINLFKEPKEKEPENLSLKYDMSFDKDTTPTIIGVFIVILYLIFYILIAKGEDYNAEVSGIFSVIFLVFRIFIIIWVINIAKKLNRNITNWGLLAFFFPSLTLIVIGQKRKYKNNS